MDVAQPVHTPPPPHMHHAPVGVEACNAPQHGDLAVHHVLGGLALKQAAYLGVVHGRGPLETSPLSTTRLQRRTNAGRRPGGEIRCGWGRPTSPSTSGVDVVCVFDPLFTCVVGVFPVCLCVCVFYGLGWIADAVGVTGVSLSGR